MINFDTLAMQMQRLEMPVPERRMTVSVPDSRAVLRQALGYFLTAEGRTLEWLPEYEGVASWLAANEGRGLFMYGHCGRGKSLLCRYVLPAVLLAHYGRVVSVFDMAEMNSRPDYVLSRNLISLDDVGTEEVSNVYGNRRMAFAEIMDAAEKHGKLVIVSTNLTPNEIKQRYGDRVLERIRATTTRVLFEGESKRR